eukprot:4579381-Ditylum_brightwellii.AAC.1
MASLADVASLAEWCTNETIAPTRGGKVIHHTCIQTIKSKRFSFNKREITQLKTMKCQKMTQQTRGCPKISCFMTGNL